MRATPASAGRSSHVRLLLVAVAALLAALCAAGATWAAAPPGRAYERVSPADKGGGDVVVNWRAAPHGGGAAYSTLSAFAGTPGIALIAEYVARRGAGDWVSEPYHPLPLGPGQLFNLMFPTDISDDFTQMIGTGSGRFSTDDGDTVVDVWRIGPGLDVELLSQGSVVGVPDDRQGEAAPGAATPDGSHVLIETSLPLEPGAPGGAPQVYDRTGGQTILVGRDEAGDPLPAAQVGGGRTSLGAAGEFAEPSAISEDGSRIFYSTPFPRALYVRENGASTEYSVSQRTGSVGTPATEADWQMSSADGGRAFFISPDQLTDDATPSGGLYAYDVESGDLEYLSTGSTDPGGAQVLGVVKVSDDGSRAYFVARDALGGEGIVGAPNLYLWDDGALSFVATLAEASADDAQVWASFGEGYRMADITPDGSRLVLVSSAQLTAYDNAGVQQVYMYDAEADEMTCASCPPGAPTAPAGLDEQGNLLFFSSVPGGITDDGETIQFQTADPLVPQDSNGVPDAYIWEGGEAHILSSGQARSPSIIGGMSNDGTDVFFLTRESLVPADTDQGIMDVYDARVGGGLAAQQLIPADDCQGDECRPGPPPVRFDPPATIGLDGIGNIEEEPPASFAVRAIGAGAKRRFARTGRLALRVQVSEAGRVAARATSGGDTVASASRRTARGGTVRLVLRLNQAARDRLENTGRLRLTLRVTYSEVARASVARFTLRSGGGR